MNFPIIISNTAGLIGILSIGVGIGLLLFFPAGMVFGWKTRRLPPSVRRELLQNEAMRASLMAKDAKISDLKCKMADMEGKRLAADSLLAESERILQKAREVNRG